MRSAVKDIAYYHPTKSFAGAGFTRRKLIAKDAPSTVIVRTNTNQASRIYVQRFLFLSLEIGLLYLAVTRVCVGNYKKCPG